MPSPTPIELNRVIGTPTTHIRTSEIHATITSSPLPTLVDTPTSNTYTISKICSPLASTTLAELASIVSDGYHPPPEGNDGRHQGVDFAYYRKFGRLSILGDVVQSIMDGTVAARIQDSFPYGNVIIIETPSERIPREIRESLELSDMDSIYVLYAHLAEIETFMIGDGVKACQGIGTVGKSGNAGAAHLHLETRVGLRGQEFVSMAYYVANATEEERENYLLWRTSGKFKHFDPLSILLIQ